MKSISQLAATLIFVGFGLSAAALPPQPIDPAHPGSNHYEYTVKKEVFQFNGRTVDVFLPAEAANKAEKVPVVVFGHGQGINVQGYELTFVHLAKKGIAVVHPMYDKGFMDQDWRRMADDFNLLANEAITKYSSFVDATKIIYAGHSKGAYIALMAAGAPSIGKYNLSLRSIFLLAPAGYDNEYLQKIKADIPITLVWSDQDTIIKQSLITEIFQKLPLKFKQWILVKSYDELKADHFFPLSKSYFFGGRDGLSAYHYYASWKWLAAAAFDVAGQNNKSHVYLYGSEAAKTGVDQLTHVITKNW